MSCRNRGCPGVRPGRRSFDLAAVQQGVRDGQLVDIFQFVAEADAAGYGGDFQSRELPEGVEGRKIEII